MAKRPGAAGVILVAAVLGLVTAYLIWAKVRDIEKSARANWRPVVTARADMATNTKVTEALVELKYFPPENIAPNAVTNLNEAVGKRVKSNVNAMDQLRATELVKEGEMSSLSDKIPPGKRAVAIGVDEVKGAGQSVQPGDHIDVLATYTDPNTRQETTQMILQYIEVLQVDRGNQEAKPGQGASTSITLAVSPEDSELLTAADRAGVLRVALRPLEENAIVNTGGTRVSEIRGKMVFESAATTAAVAANTQTNATVSATPIIISPPKPTRTEMKIVRGVVETVTPLE